MDFEFIILVSIILLFASFVHGSVGFGFAMIPTPLIALFIDIQTAIVLTLIPTLLVNLVSFLSEGNILNALKRFLPLAILVMIGSAIGTQVLIYTNSDFFKLLLAFIILFYLFANKINLSIPSFKSHPKSTFIGFSLFAGLIGGLTNVIGPVLMIYALEAKYTKSELIQAMNLAFLLGKIIQIILFSLNGSFSQETLEFSFISIFLISFSLYLGIKAKEKMNTEVYLKLIKIVLFVISFVLIFQVVF